MAKSVREEFAERLKLALDEAGYRDSKLKELGALFAVTPQAVRKWLHGEAMPTASHAPMVAGRLGVRRAWLLDNELPMRPPLVDMAEHANQYAAAGSEAVELSKEEFRLLVAYRSLPHPLRVVVVQVAETMSRELAPEAQLARRGRS